MTELITDTNGNEKRGLREYGIGELNGVIEGDDWRASFEISIEAPNKYSVKQRAEEIIKGLQEAGDVENL